MRSASPLLLVLALQLLLSACSPGSAGAEGAAATGAELDSTANTSGPARQVPGEGLVLLPPLQVDTGPVAQPELERAYFHSFGRVPYGEQVSHVFRLRNSDAEPVAILSITPGCGCTVPEVRYRAEDGSYHQGRRGTGSDEPMIEIPPGAVAEVELALDTRLVSTKNADKTVQTTITTNSPNGFYVKLETHIVVEVPFHLVPNGIDLGGIPRSAGGRGSLDIVRAPGYTLELDQLLEIPDGVTAELRPKGGGLVGAWVLEANVEGPLDEGRWNGEIVISTRHPDGEPGAPVVVSLQADPGPDLVFTPERLVFVAARATEGDVVLRSLLAGHRFAITAAEPDAAHAQALSVRYAPRQPDSRGRSEVWDLHVEWDDAQAPSELQRGELRLALDDPAHPERLLTYVLHPAAR